MTRYGEAQEKDIFRRIDVTIKNFTDACDEVPDDQILDEMKNHTLINWYKTAPKFVRNFYELVATLSLMSSASLLLGGIVIVEYC